MDKSKATVTIPYVEFEKHEKEVEEIKWAREFKKKVDSGQFFPKEKVDELCRKLLVMGFFIRANENNSHIFGKVPLDFRSFAKENGYTVTIENKYDGTLKPDTFYCLEEIKK